MSLQTIARRLAAIEYRRKDGEGFLIYTHEVPDGRGGLILLSDRVNWGQGDPVEVGRVPRHLVGEHLRETIRIERSYGRATP